MVRERRIQDDQNVNVPLSIERNEIELNGLSKFVGQNAIKLRLAGIIENAKRSDSPFPHLIISGPKNSGRRTLASAIANELGVNFECVDASSLKQTKDLIPYLTNLERNSFLVISDLEKLSKIVYRFFESAIKYCRIDIKVGEGSSASTLNLDLQPFSCISITSNPEKISHEVSDISIPFKFVPYTVDEAVEILFRKCNAIGIDLDRHIRIDPDLLRKVVVSVHYSTDDAVNLIRKAVAVGGNTITEKSFQLIGHAFSDSADLVSPVERKEKIQAMSGRQFEEFVASLFSRKGYAVQITPESGDHGIDLHLTRSGKSGVVQCKCWSGMVGEKEIREFFGAMHHAKAEFGFFVAGTDFSSRAREFSRGKNIALVDINDLTTNPDWFV